MQIAQIRLGLLDERVSNANSHVSPDSNGNAVMSNAVMFNRKCRFQNEHQSLVTVPSSHTPRICVLVPLLLTHHHTPCEALTPLTPVCPVQSYEALGGPNPSKSVEHVRVITVLVLKG